MKKTAILLLVLVLLLAGCALPQAPTYDTAPATLPQLGGETVPDTQTPAQTDAPAETDAPEKEHPSLPHSRTPDVPIDEAAISVSKVIEYAGRRPQLGETHVFPLPAEQVSVNELVFSAKVQDGSVLVTLHSDNCYQGKGLGDRVSEFTLSSGDEINIAVRDGDTETVYQFTLTDGE